MIGVNFRPKSKLSDAIIIPGNLLVTSVNSVHIYFICVKGIDVYFGGLLELADLLL